MNWTGLMLGRRLPRVMAAVSIADDHYGSIRTIAEYEIRHAPRESTARLARRVERIALRAAADRAAEAVR